MDLIKIIYAIWGVFGWQLLDKQEQLTPMLRVDNQWQVISWEEAIRELTENYTKKASKGIVTVPGITLEEMLVLQRTSAHANTEISIPHTRKDWAEQLFLTEYSPKDFSPHR